VDRVDPWNSERKSFSTGQIASIFEVSIPTVHRWLKSGILPHFRLPGSTKVRVNRTDLLRFMEKHGHPGAPATSSQRVKIIAVDDEPMILDLVRRTFEDAARFEVRCAANGFEAGLLAASFDADVIFLDIELPDMDGRRVARLIRGHRTSSVPRIYAISGAITDEEAGLLRGAGFDGFLRKPISPKALLAKVAPAPLSQPRRS